MTIQPNLTLLEESLKELKQTMIEIQRTMESTYATHEYVQTYVQLMVGDSMAVHDQYTENTPIASYVPINTAQIMRHFNQAQQSYTRADWQYIVYHYDTTCKIANINPYIAIAQMVKETDFGRSWWSQRPRRNPVGLGVTGETSETEPKDKKAWFHREDGLWVKGYSFPDWSISIQAHIGHLLTYLYEESRVRKEWKVFIDIDPRSSFVKNRGKIKTLKDLDGIWAIPGIGYGRSISIIANVLRT